MFDSSSPEVAALTAALDALSAADVPEVDAVLAADVRALLAQRARIEGLLVERLRAFDARQLPDADGASSVAAWTVAQTRLAPGEVCGLLALGRSAARHPVTGALHRDGLLSSRHARVVYAALRGLPQSLQDAGDAFLAAQAEGLTPSELRWVADRWRETVEPELAAAEAEAALEEQYLHASPTWGGVKVDGWLTGLNAERFLAGIERFAKPLPHDQRSAAVRRADAAGTLGRIAVEADDAARSPEAPPAELPVTRVTVLTDVVTLERARQAMTGEAKVPAWSAVDRRDLVQGAHGERSLSRLSWPELVSSVCDGSTQRIVMDADSQPLDLGRVARLFSAGQRRALARGGRMVCAWKRCASPWVEAHHRLPWSEGGRTDLDNGLLLCGYHHRLVHQGWTLRDTPRGPLPTPPPDWDERRRARRRRAHPPWAPIPEADAAAVTV